MPTIPVNLGDVTSDDLPEGTYLAQVDAHKFNEATGDKQMSVRMGYEVIEEGDHLGRKASQWLYFSEKAIFRTKKHYAKFGLEDLENFEVADDSDDIIEPDLIGVQVIIESKLETDRRDPNGPKRSRVSLVSVEDDMSEALEPPKSTAKAAKATEKPAQDEGDEDDEEEEAPAPRRVAAARRPAAAGKRTLR